MSVPVKDGLKSGFFTKPEQLVVRNNWKRLEEDLLWDIDCFTSLLGEVDLALFAFILVESDRQQVFFPLLFGVENSASVAVLLDVLIADSCVEVYYHEVELDSGLLRQQACRSLFDLDVLALEVKQKIFFPLS